MEEAVRNHKDSLLSFKSLSKGTGILKNIGGYLSDTDKKRIIDIAKKISPKNIEESIDFLRHTQDVLSDADINKIIDNTPIIRRANPILDVFEIKEFNGSSRR